MELAFCMGAIGLTWLVLGLVFCGLGCGLRRLFGLREFTGEDFLDDFWVGWALVLPLLVLWNFLWPVDCRAFACIAALGLAGLLSQGRALWRVVRTRLTSGSRRWAYLALLIVLALFFTNQACGASICYDTGLYHITTMRWAEAHAVVPGLANLHGRLGFNQTFFLYAALVDWGPWAKHGQHVANGLLVLACFAPIGVSLIKTAARLLEDLARLFAPEDRARSRKEPPRRAVVSPLPYKIPNLKSQIEVGEGRVREGSAGAENVVHVFRLLIAPGLLCYLSAFPWIASPTPDIAALVFGCALGTAVLRALAPRRADIRIERHAVFQAVLLCCVGVTLKLSLFVFGILAAGVVALVWVWRRGLAGTLREKWFAAALAASAAAVLIPWMARGIVLSGYPLYPQSLGGAPVEWRVPSEAVDYERLRTTAWARAPGKDYEQVLADWSWFRPWLERYAHAPQLLHYPLYLAAAGIVVGGVFRALNRRKGRRVGARPCSAGFQPAEGGRQGCLRYVGAVWWFILPAACGVVFWFFGAPDLRLAGATLWVLAAGGLALAAAEWPWPAARGVLRGLVLIGFAALFFGMFRLEWWRVMLVDEAGPDGGFWPLRQVELKTTKTDSGLVLYSPKDTRWDQCWDGPLLSTPYPRRELRLRREGELSAGFTVQPPAGSAAH